MLTAFGLRVLVQSSLLLAGLFACWVEVPRRVVGVLAGSSSAIASSNCASATREPAAPLEEHRALDQPSG